MPNGALDMESWLKVEHPFIRQGYPEDILQLHPDLRPYVVESPALGLSLKHPLHYEVIGIIWMQANAIYEHKVQRLAKAQAEEDWHTVVFLHERPWRITILNRLWNEGSITRPQLRDLLATVWTDAEYPSQHGKRLLLRLFKAAGFITDDPNVDLYLAAEPPSQRVEDRLPEVITIYRGQPIGEKPGLSWTLDPDMGAWFARRYRGDATALLLKGTVKREKVLAYFEGRGEKEVVVDPRYVTFEVIDLPPAKGRSDFQPGFPKVTNVTPEGTEVSITS